MKEIPACWIRGSMNLEDIKDDPVRQATHECPHRKSTGWSMFGPTHDCHHPAALSEHESTQSNGEAVMVGGIDGFATYCLPVDMHLQSLGEESRYIIDAEYTVLQVVEEDNLLPPPKDE